MSQISFDIISEIANSEKGRESFIAVDGWRFFEIENELTFPDDFKANLNEIMTVVEKIQKNEEYPIVEVDEMNCILTGQISVLALRVLKQNYVLARLISLNSKKGSGRASFGEIESKAMLILKEISKSEGVTYTKGFKKYSKGN